MKKQKGLWPLSLLLVPLLVCPGCGGFSATKSISPLDFLLPGILRVDPKQPALPDSTNSLVCLNAPSLVPNATPVLSPLEANHPLAAIP